MFLRINNQGVPGCPPRRGPPMAPPPPRGIQNASFFHSFFDTLLIGFCCLTNLPLVSTATRSKRRRINYVFGERQYGVLSFLFLEDNTVPDSDFFKRINDNFMVTPDAKKVMEFWMKEFTDLLPRFNDFWMYEGSTTSPECKETVNWYLNK